jgi:hypothetical protein
MTRQPESTNLIRALHCSLKLAVVSPRRRETYHDHSHPNRSQLIGVNICLNAVVERQKLTNLLPCLPVRNTSPFPRAATHALSSPFGSTYIASSPRRCFASISTDIPERRPPSQNDCLETSAASSHAGMCRPTSARCMFCVEQK